MSLLHPTDANKFGCPNFWRAANFPSLETLCSETDLVLLARKKWSIHEAKPPVGVDDETHFRFLYEHTRKSAPRPGMLKKTHPKLPQKHDKAKNLTQDTCPDEIWKPKKDRTAVSSVCGTD